MTTQQRAFQNVYSCRNGQSSISQNLSAGLAGELYYSVNQSTTTRQTFQNYLPVFAQCLKGRSALNLIIQCLFPRPKFLKSNFLIQTSHIHRRSERYSGCKGNVLDLLLTEFASFMRITFNLHSEPKTIYFRITPSKINRFS